MTERDRILQVLYDFEYAGLIDNDVDKLIGCFSTRLLGIGIGEQGFVTSQDDVLAVLSAGTREEGDEVSHQLRFGRIEVLQHSDSFATVCAEVGVVTQRKGEQRVAESNFLQLLTLIKEEQGWKICALHASAPVITEESVEAYPLKFAEKTLQSLKKRIGDQVYAAEEQYRQAILADTIAFYVVNLTNNCFEKCQCNSEFCAPADEGDPYQKLLSQQLPQYVFEQDRVLFAQNFSLENLRRQFEAGKKEVSCEYRIVGATGEPIWALSVARLILDYESNDHKAILYVRNIDQRKRGELALQRQAVCDSMTGLFNKTAFHQEVFALLTNRETFVSGLFVMLDIDRFKDINDSFGHPIGDVVLTRVAGLLAAEFSAPCIVARLGGDEFGVFAPCPQGEDEILERLEQLREQISQLRFENSPGLLATCSIGTALAAPGEDFDKIYAKADSALYYSKKQGRNQVNTYDRLSAERLNRPKRDF